MPELFVSLPLSIIYHSVRMVQEMQDVCTGLTRAPLTEREKNCSGSIGICVLLFVCRVQHLYFGVMMLWLSVHMQEVGLTNGTPVETPSPASASVLFNRLQLDDDLDSDGRDPYADTETHDLFVTVDDPKKHVSTMETYITYRVSTKVCYRLVS